MAAAEVRMVWKGQIAAFMQDETRAIDLEGAFRVGKTTAALWKVFQSCLRHPGIAWLICRYSDGDTQTKLKPVWRDIATTCRVKLEWDAMSLCDHFPNGSRCYIFGIKSQDQTARYGKLRGLTLAGIYNDQTEELPKDIFQEFMGRLSQTGYPHQLILTPNPPDENHWLAHEFPEDNGKPGRAYYGVAIYENAHNLAPETIAALEDVYPPAHPKHRSAVQGKRGLNVVGEPVYKGAFVRTLHEKTCEFNPALPLDEAIDFGKHHPCIVWRQTSELGQIRYLGGIIGQSMYLEDFLPLVLQYRREWFPNPVEIRTCCDPAGAADNSHGVRSNGLLVLKAHGFQPRYDKNSNAPDVRLAMIERSAGHMRRRTPQGEAFQIQPDRWLRASTDAIVPWKFLADGFEAGYVWDEHFVSVGSKQIRKPKKDGWFEHGQNCHEYLELNFGLTPYKPKREISYDMPPRFSNDPHTAWMG